jgi:putative transposase
MRVHGMRFNIEFEVSDTTVRFVKRLRDAFPREWLEAQAKDTGLLKRIRRFDPVVLFWVLIMHVGTGTQACLDELRRGYNRRADALAYSSFYARFTPELVAFLHRCVLRALEVLPQWSNVRLHESLRGFKDILIQDSSIIRLHEKLAAKYPITRGRKAAAGIKLSCLTSVVADGPKSLRLHPERTAESKTLRIGPWVKDNILLMDLGFYKHHAFAKIKENGGHFVTRLKDSANPLVLNANTVRGRSINVEGERLHDVLGRLQRRVLDCEVELDFRRRNYNGTSRKDVVQVRLVAIRNEETNAYHCYLTTLGEEFTPEEIASLYACRWEVEIVFRQLKDKHGLDKIPFSNESAIHALIWTSILVLIAQRCALLTAQQDKPELRLFGHEKAAKIFREEATELLMLILHFYDLKFRPADLRDFETCGALRSEGARSHLQEWTA